MMKNLVLCLALVFCGNAFADRLGTEGMTQTFDVEYEQVWNAALAALDDKTIENTNKDVGQIISKAEKKTNLFGQSTATTFSVKISHAKPVKVVVHVNIEKEVSALGNAAMKATNTYSDDDAEKEVMKKIEAALKPEPVKEAVKK